MVGFTLRTANRAESSEAVPIIYEAVNELVQEGHMPYSGMTLGVLPDDSVTYVVSGPGDIIGVLCYRMSGYEIVVSLAYVEPSSRKLGVFNAMWDNLLDRYRSSAGKIVVKVPASQRNAIWLKILHEKLKFIPSEINFTGSIG